MLKNLKTWHWVAIGVGVYLLYSWYRKRQNGMAPTPLMASGSNGESKSIGTDATFINPNTYGEADRSATYYKEAIMKPIETEIGTVYTKLNY